MLIARSIRIVFSLTLFMRGRGSITSDWQRRLINDGLVKRVRVAETSPGTTRVVFDLVGQAEYTVSRLDTPDRIVIEITPGGSKTRATGCTNCGDANPAGNIAGGKICCAATAR